MDLLFRCSKLTSLYRLCWYAAEKYLRDLKAKEEFSPRVLEGVEALADFLVADSRTMERGNEQAKKAAKEEDDSGGVRNPIFNTERFGQHILKNPLVAQGCVCFC